MKNFYPEKSMQPYHATKVNMDTAIAALLGLNYSDEVRRAAYIIFRMESANGAKGINENYCGFQADSGRWETKYDHLITGVVEKVENKTGKKRLFLAFHDVAGCLQMLVNKLKDRGLYIGGTVDMPKLGVYLQITDITDLARAYVKTWAAGSKAAEPTTQLVNSFKSMYCDAMKNAL